MAIRKSELYRSLWASCDELRGGMDASQYKDYVLVLLFIKYVSDKYAGKPYAPIEVPKGASFADMVKLKGTADIGDQINKRILEPLRKANHLSDLPDFNDPNKLGNDKERVQRLTNLIAIFENPALDFSKNRADGDDLMGDAYEYLMRHFATESGKSKGQFYTPAEVSRVIAQVLGIRDAKVSNNTTVYDPTCGSASLLLKVADEAAYQRDAHPTLYGQEKDASTAGLARMNMILHDFPGAEIRQGNTLTDPKFKNGEALQTFDYVVANPPFSDKRWSTGLNPEHDPYQRFAPYGIPPAKQGDYAYLLHILRSMKPHASGACILPHGVLFRGNAEAAIRKNLIERGVIKGIIGLPPNLFYGTGIPACIVVLDKRQAATRDAIFMVDASKGFQKDGPKNRLRSRDIHRIVETFTQQRDVPGYARLVPVSEIMAEKNDGNLNLPRYIDSGASEDLQDIDAHLNGGIPKRDIDALGDYWAVLPGVRQALFAAKRPGYARLKPPLADVRAAILDHPEFETLREQVLDRFGQWRKSHRKAMRDFASGDRPATLIATLSDTLLQTFKAAPLVDPYAIYQHLMEYWSQTMQDDGYLIAPPAEDGGGWQAKPYRIIEEAKNGKQKDKGWACDLVPKPLVVARYLAAEQAALDALQAELDATGAARDELEEEHGGDDQAFNGFDKINKASVSERIAEIDDDPDSKDELKVLKRWLKLSQQETAQKKALKAADATLDAAAYAKYADLDKPAIQQLVVDDKWLATLEAGVYSELQRVSQQLTGRVRELAARYAEPLPQISQRVDELQAKVDAHLKKMGFAWA